MSEEPDFTTKGICACSSPGYTHTSEAHAAVVEPDWERPTMSQAECRCPAECECDGRFACEVQAGTTHAFCERVVGHPGRHRSGGHRWDRSKDDSPNGSMKP